MCYNKSDTTDSQHLYRPRLGGNNVFIRGVTYVCIISGVVIDWTDWGEINHDYIVEK